MQHRKVSIEYHNSNGKIEEAIWILREGVLKSPKLMLERKTIESIETYNKCFNSVIEMPPIEAVEDEN